MLKTKKIIALIMGLIMMLGLMLTGCGKNNDTPTNDEKVSEKPTNLIWYAVGPPQKDNERVIAELNKYLIEKINTTIEYKQVDYGDYTKKMQLVINSGEEYDICFTASWGNDYLGNSRRGAFLPLNELLDSHGKEVKKAIDPRFWEGVKIDGQIYGIPTNKELGTDEKWVFTKEYVDKYDIPYQDIHTLEDLEPWLKVIKENEPDVTPLYVNKEYVVPEHFDRLLQPLGVSVLNNDLKIENMFENEEYVKNIKTMRRFYLEGYINKDAVTTKDSWREKTFVKKQAGQPFADNLWSKDAGYDVVSTSVGELYVTNASATGSLQAISATSKHPEKAMEFLNLLNTDKYVRNMMNYGIEDVHYEKISENKIKFKPERENFSQPSFALGHLFLTYLLEEDPDNKWEAFQEFNDSAIASPALGFKFDLEPVSTEAAGLQNVVKEFRIALFSGSVDPDEYLKKVNDKLKAMGIEVVMEEMQKQIDEWKTNK